MATGLGITLPIQLGNTGYFEQAFDLQTQARSNLINLLLTKPGERIMQPTLGCKIHEQIFSPNDTTFDSQVDANIRDAVEIWLPYVNITDIGIQKDVDRNRAIITITYNLLNRPNSTDTVSIVV